MTMTGIWTQDAEGWKLSPPEGFVDEAALHDLIEQTPEMLPLSGTPTLLILGREVNRPGFPGGHTTSISGLDIEPGQTSAVRRMFLFPRVWTRASFFAAFSPALSESRRAATLRLLA